LDFNHESLSGKYLTQDIGVFATHINELRPSSGISLAAFGFRQTKPITAHHPVKGRVSRGLHKSRTCPQECLTDGIPEGEVRVLFYAKTTDWVVNPIRISCGDGF